MANAKKYLEKMRKDDRDALRDAEDAILQAQSRIRELGYLAHDSHVKEIINATAVQVGEVFGRLREHINDMAAKDSQT